MKLKFVLSKKALRDIEQIWAYTATQWNKTQANNYYKLILKEIDAVCKNPEIGRSIKEVKQNHRIKIFKSHFIVYKIQDEIIYIDRILHQKMDIDNIL